jgi:hypothetical protein
VKKEARNPGNTNQIRAGRPGRVFKMVGKLSGFVRFGGPPAVIGENEPASMNPKHLKSGKPVERDIFCPMKLLILACVNSHTRLPVMA